MRLLYNIGECIYWVSFWGYKESIPYFTSLYTIEDLFQVVRPPAYSISWAVLFDRMLAWFMHAWTLSPI